MGAGQEMEFHANHALLLCYSLDKLGPNLLSPITISYNLKVDDTGMDKEPDDNHKNVPVIFLQLYQLPFLSTNSTSAKDY